MANPWDPTPLEMPEGWLRGDTIGPLVLEVDAGRPATGAVATLTFRAEHEDGPVVQTCSSDPALVADGQGATVDVDPADLNRLIVTFEPWEPNTAGKLVYDIQFHWPDGNPRVRTPYKGVWRLRKDVTK